MSSISEHLTECVLCYPL